MIRRGAAGRPASPLRRLAGPFALTLLLLVPAPASAEFHFVSIRELHPGSAGQPDAEYVQLQAYAPGQHVVAGHSVVFYSATGAKTGSATFATNVANGQDQMTMLIATAAAESAFATSADQGMAPNLIDPAGGAVCWAGLDCVAWGSFSGSLPSPAGSPATPAGIPDGMALRRTIAPSCPTLLEAFDDRNQSGLDFFAAFPAPRPNSVPPPERPCASGGSGGSPPAGGGGVSRPPNTRLVRRPAKRSRDRTPTFRFRASVAGARFQCKLDRRRYRRCRSPFTARRLRVGRHTFRVRARDASGRVDRSPARYAFRILRRR